MIDWLDLRPTNEFVYTMLTQKYSEN